jgi:glycosyltransferase involved in cell wall biosynthesis
MYFSACVRVSVVIPTYKRAWALPYVLDSLSKQSIKPDEVVIILKPSGDNSENIIKKFYEILNIKIVLQSGGHSSTAYALGIKAARGDLLLFMDDDAIAHPDWVKNYINLFNELADAGAIGGFEYKAYMINGVPHLTREPLYHDDITKKTYYRAPLRELVDYCRWLSVSGYPGGQPCNGSIVKSIHLSGMNMGYRRDVIKDINLEKYYKNSRKSFYFELFMGYYVIKKGFNVYKVLDINKAPVVWHLESHRDSLTRTGGFWGEFWLHYDRASMFFRLKKLGASVSLPAYLLASLATMRKRTLPRLLATLYAILYNSIKL